MSIEYDEYLEKHINCVIRGVRWMLTNVATRKIIDEIFPNLDIKKLVFIVSQHDQSKYSYAEYEAYDDYFYGKKSNEVNTAFDIAWLHHIHENPHHWQHWILIEDEGGLAINNHGITEVKPLEMPDIYIIEMVADWWSFSINKYMDTFDKKDLYGIFKWFSEHLDRIQFNYATRTKVYALLNALQESLDNTNNITFA